MVTISVNGMCSNTTWVPRPKVKTSWMGKGSAQENIWLSWLSPHRAQNMKRRRLKD